jgi:hypothetical protein
VSDAQTGRVTWPGAATESVPGALPSRSWRGHARPLTSPARVARGLLLLREHEQQRRLLRYALSSLDETTAASTLVLSVRSLLASLRADMVHEEHALLNPELLKDDTVDCDMMTG